MWLEGKNFQLLLVRLLYGSCCCHLELWTNRQKLWRDSGVLGQYICGTPKIWSGAIFQNRDFFVWEWRPNIWISRIEKRIFGKTWENKNEKLLEFLPKKELESELEDSLMGEDSSFRIIVKIYRCLSKIPPAGILNSLCTSNRTASVLQDAKVNYQN